MVERWHSKYKGMDASPWQRLRELEAENARLKKIGAQQLLDNEALKDLLGKKGQPISQAPGRFLFGGKQTVGPASGLSAGGPRPI